MTPACAECEDEPGTVYFDMGADFAYWTGQPRRVVVCVDCRSRLENLEPREATFDEALGAVCGARERQIEAQRLK